MAKIETYIIPRKLYRYRSIEGGRLIRELDAIRSGSIYASNFSSLNDPMEGSFRLSKLMKKRDDADEIEQRVFDKKGGIGIACFSESYRNELMWAHYGDQFRGICISYDVKKLLRSLPENATFTRLNYSEISPPISESHEIDLSAKSVLSTKSSRWQYEQEWRMFGDLGVNAYTDRKAVTRVYVGCRVKRTVLKTIKDKLCEFTIPIWMMDIDQYNISFSSI